MIFRPFYRFDTGCAAYVFGCGSVGQAAVVDPHLADLDRYVEFAAQKGLRIVQVIDTHVHADHPSGGPALAERVGAAYRLHEAARVEVPFQPLRDAEQVVLGNTRVEVRHTPGHTDDSVCLVVTDLRRGDAPWFVLTGDTLFVGAVGRPDLPGDAEAHAGMLYDSLHREVLTLPGEVEVFPGHFAGSPCGVGLSGKPSSTLAFERRWNPLLSLARAEFIQAICANLPPPPQMAQGLAPSRDATGSGGAR